jgi:hypothetical protein
MVQVAKAGSPFTIDPAGDGWRRLDDPPLVASDACRLALDVYEHAFRLCSIVEPDIGFAERYASGRSSLDARSHAGAWALTPERLAAVYRLLDEVSQASADEAGDWVDRFPRAFLEVLDRRTGPGMLPDVPGRRFGERMRAPVAAVDREG